MIRGFHVIITTYGFWLPNDPRGSWSDYVRKWELLHFGEATKLTTRRSVAGEPHDHEKRFAAKRELKYPVVIFTGVQARAVGIGFGTAIDESEYPVHACSILPQHVHMVIGWQKRKINLIIGHLKGRATQQLSADGLHPLADHRLPNGDIPSP